MSFWNGKVVVVTGGSKGLGLSIGEAFAAQSATVILLARTEVDLENAIQNSKFGSNLHAQVCDVLSDQSVQQAVDRIVADWNQIDIWVNNVGISTRVRLSDCSVDQYRTFLEVNCLAAIRCTQACLDHLVKSSGQVVNIGSLAAKTGWPNVAPYVVSKHALAGYSHQFRLEGPANVNCLFVGPGPIRRTDSGTRYAEQVADSGLSDKATQPGAGVKLKGIPPEKLANLIVSCCRKRRGVLIVPFSAKMLFAVAQLSSRLGDFLLGLAAKK
ncbi:MAG: SDR family oxidoreductase [Planctomycetota bacterium]